MLLSWLYEGFVAWFPISTYIVRYGNRLSSALSGQIMKDMITRESFVAHTKEMIRKSTAVNTRARDKAAQQTRQHLNASSSLHATHLPIYDLATTHPILHIRLQPIHRLDHRHQLTAKLIQQPQVIPIGRTLEVLIHRCLLYPALSIVFQLSSTGDN
jgi:hypothetical protein